MSLQLSAAGLEEPPLSQGVSHQRPGAGMPGPGREALQTTVLNKKEEETPQQLLSCRAPLVLCAGGLKPGLSATEAGPLFSELPHKLPLILQADDRF